MFTAYKHALLLVHLTNLELFNYLDDDIMLCCGDFGIWMIHDNDSRQIWFSSYNHKRHYIYIYIFEFYEVLVGLLEANLWDVKYINVNPILVLIPSPIREIIKANFKFQYHEQWISTRLIYWKSASGNITYINELELWFMETCVTSRFGAKKIHIGALDSCWVNLAYKL